MSEDLITKIKQWNDKKYGNIDYTDRTTIILKTLKPAIDYTIVWKDGTKTFQNQDGTVTTAPKYK